MASDLAQEFSAADVIHDFDTDGDAVLASTDVSIEVSAEATEGEASEFVASSTHPMNFVDEVVEPVAVVEESASTKDALLKEKTSSKVEEQTADSASYQESVAATKIPEEDDVDDIVVTTENEATAAMTMMVGAVDESGDDLSFVSPKVGDEDDGGESRQQEEAALIQDQIIGEDSSMTPGSADHLTSDGHDAARDQAVNVEEAIDQTTVNASANNDNVATEPVQEANSAKSEETTSPLQKIKSFFKFR